MLHDSAPAVPDDARRDAALERGAAFGARLAAGALDWGFWAAVLLVLSIAPDAVAAAIGWVLIAAPLAYFPLMWHNGATLGMRARGLWIVAADGRPPSFARAAWRAAGMLVPLVAAFVLFGLLVVSDRPDAGWSGTDLVAAGTLALVVAGAVAGHVWQLRDRRGRTVQDRLFGVVVVARAAPRWRRPLRSWAQYVVPAIGAGAGLLAGVAVLAAAVWVLGDEKGMPVPYEHRGRDCERAGDLLLCDRSGPSTDLYVRVGERWVVPTRCRDVSPTLTRCARPYALEVDFGGDWTKLRRLDAGGR